MAGDPLIDLYLQTLITVELDGVFVPADAAARNGAFHVVTAWNPGSRRMSEGVNRKRSRRLRETLLARSLNWRPAIGASPDGAWQEESYAVWGLSRPEAVELGRSFQQKAVFEVDLTAVFVISCTDSAVFSRPHQA